MTDFQNSDFNYSDRVKKRIECPIFLKQQVGIETSDQDSFFNEFYIPNSNGVLKIWGKVEEIDGKIKVFNLGYTTNIHGPALGFIDATIALLDEKSLDEMSSLTLREVEYFLRDDNHVPSLPNDGTSMYRIFDFVGELYQLLACKFADATQTDSNKFNPDLVRDYQKRSDRNKLSAEEFEKLSPSLKQDFLSDVMDKFIRPNLIKDGGDAQLVFADNAMMAITYSGSCSGCDSALTSTMDFIQDVVRSETGDPHFMVVTDS